MGKKEGRNSLGSLNLFILLYARQSTNWLPPPPFPHLRFHYSKDHLSLTGDGRLKLLEKGQLLCVQPRHLP